jgi:hypothetical protein
MRKVIIPGNLEPELSTLGVSKVEYLRDAVAEELSNGKTRQDILEALSGEGLSEASSSWLFSQVKDKGASFELVYVGNSEVQADAALRLAKYENSEMNLGGALWLVGWLLMFLEAGLCFGLIAEIAVPIFILSVALRIFGLWKVAEARGYDGIWGLSSLCFVDLFVILFFFIMPKRA